jgi:hypothetical protein
MVEVVLYLMNCDSDEMIHQNKKSKNNGHRRKPPLSIDSRLSNQEHNTFKYEERTKSALLLKLK